MVLLSVCHLVATYQGKGTNIHTHTPTDVYFGLWPGAGAVKIRKQPGLKILYSQQQKGGLDWAVLMIMNIICTTSHLA